jgi:glutamyl-tRNA synthetase
LEAALEDLRWLGLSWEEGPDVGGPFAPYSQSQRSPLYLEAFETLRSRGWIYPCFCSRRDIASALSAPHGPTGDLYPGTCRPSKNASDSAPASNARAGTNWRFQIPAPELLRFEDLHLGPQEAWAGKQFGDFLVWRKDDSPAYQLATVVDDVSLQISEVVRGADLIESTFQQLLLYRALEVPPPDFYHTALLCDSERQRLAKRNDALALRSLRAQGLSPADVQNQIRLHPRL